MIRDRSYRNYRPMFLQNITRIHKLDKSGELIDLILLFHDPKQYNIQITRVSKNGYSHPQWWIFMFSCYSRYHHLSTGLLITCFCVCWSGCPGLFCGLLWWIIRVFFWIVITIGGSWCFSNLGFFNYYKLINHPTYYVAFFYFHIVMHVLLFLWMSFCWVEFKVWSYLLYLLVIIHN